MKKLKGMENLSLAVDEAFRARQLEALDRFLKEVPGIVSASDRDIDNAVIPWIIRNRASVAAGENLFDHPRLFTGGGTRWLVSQIYVDRRPDGPPALDDMLKSSELLQAFMKCRGISCRVMPSECSWHFPGRTVAVLFERPKDAPKKTGDCTSCPWCEHLPGPRGGTHRCLAKGYGRM